MSHERDFVLFNVHEQENKIKITMVMKDAKALRLGYRTAGRDMEDFEQRVAYTVSY